MRVVAPLPGSRAQCLKSFVLPEIKGEPSGPIHTVVLDEDGGLYYSDELNHYVVALTSQSVVRWVMGGRGSARHEFVYPRGLSLGWACGMNGVERCLAVCDAWNHRVKVLGLDGKELALWTHYGDRPFSEVAGLAYVGGEGIEPAAEGYWLVVDKGNHCVVALGQDGSFLFKIGRALSPALTGRWATPGLCLNAGLLPGTVRSYPPLDYGYFPDRILGRSERALFVWEPLSRTLKQLLQGNLLPLSIRGAESVEWMGADDDGLVGWVQRTNHVRGYNAEGWLKYECEIAGRPVLSDRPCDEFCVQTDNRIQHWAWMHDEGGYVLDGTPSARFGLLLGSAQSEMERFDESEALNALETITAIANGFIVLADEVLSLANNEQVDMERPREIRVQLPQMKLEHSQSSIRLHSAMHHLCLSDLLTQLVRCLPGQQTAPIEAQSARREETFLEPLRRKWEEIQERIDGLHIMRLLLVRNQLHDTPYAEQLCVTALKLEQDLAEIAGWFHRWSGRIDSATEVMSFPAAATASASLQRESCTPGSVISRPAAGRYHKLDTCFKEVDRITLAREISCFPLRPHSICRSSTGEILVSLNGANQIVELDSAGKLLSSSGKPGRQPGDVQNPTGVALDCGGRLWVAEYSSHHIKVIDGETVRVIGSPGSAIGQFSHPVGLHIQPDGSVLVADTANHRIVRITSDGIYEILCDRIGSRLGELCYPHSFYPHPKDGFPLIVDARNHRILKLMPGGEFELVLGRRGLDEGCLYRPYHVAMFADGAVAIAHNQLENNLKLFSVARRELGKLSLDYVPGGLLVVGERLLVAEFSGDCLRVYQRL